VALFPFDVNRRINMKTGELTGAALDWAVAKCEGKVFDLSPDGYYTYKPSRNWALGGPIIERERINLKENGAGWWFAKIGDKKKDKWMRGTDPLMAAMRCYVASRLGDDVTVPDGVV
jgi:hypothetical protein